MLRINIRDWEVKYGNSILIILQSLLNILSQNIHLTDSVKRFSFLFRKPEVNILQGMAHTHFS